jgi:hypothetical protein
MKTIGVLAFAFGIGEFFTFAQPACPPIIQWQKSFGTPSTEYPMDVQQTRDGGFIVGGWSPYFPIPGGNKTSPSYGSHDFWIVRTDPAGTKLWDRSYGGNDQDTLETLHQTSDGGFILGGTTWYASSGGNKTSTNYGSSDFWVVRTDASGYKLWDRSFGADGYESLQSIQQTSDGGFILAGVSSSWSTNEVKTAQPLGDDDFWIVRLDAEGNRLWDRTYGAGLKEHANVIRQTPDGGFLIGGSTQGGLNFTTRRGFGNYDFWIVRIDANGNKLWDNLFGGPAQDELVSIALTTDGGCVLGGWSLSINGGNKTSANYGGPDYWVIRLDAGGNKVWERSYGGVEWDILGSISANSDGTFLLAGYSLSPPGGSKTTPLLGGWDCWLIRIDGNGNELWQAGFGGQSSETPEAAHQTTDGGYIFTGRSSSMDGDRNGQGFGSDDFWLVKLTPDNPDDCDHDGVPNSQDECAETPLGSVINAQGCSIAQLCPCAMESHDEYVTCVRDAARAFQQAGLISNSQRRQLVENARAASCPPSAGPGEGFIFGLAHRPIGDARLDFQPDWFSGLHVFSENYYEEPPPPPFGISIALGEADSGLFVYPDGNYANYGEGWFFDATAYESNGDLISSVRVRKPYYETYPVSVDLSPLRPESLTIQVLSNRTVLVERTFDDSFAAFQVSGSAWLEPRGNPYWRMPDGSVGALIEFTGPYVFAQGDYYRIYIGGSEDELLRGNRIFVRANNPRRHVQHVSRLDAVAGGGVPGFEVRNERLGMFNHPHQGLGSILFNASRGRLLLNTLEPFGSEDFAAVLAEAPEGSSRLEIDLDPVTLEETGDGLVLYPSGVIDVDSFVFGELRIVREVDELTLRCDYEALSDPGSSTAPLQRLEVLRNGRPVGSAIVSNRVSLSASLKDGRAPEIIGFRATVNSNGVPTLGLAFAQVTTITSPDGAQFGGNHMRLTPVNPAQMVHSISALTIEMLQLPSLTITAERSTLAPPALAIQPSSGDLLLSWTDNTQLYSLESGISLFGPFTAVTNEVTLINARNSLTLPLGQERTLFFRLTGPVD